jgi:hypothetical protein
MSRTQGGSRVSSRNFHEHFASDVKLPSERATGLVFAAVAMIAAVAFRGNPFALRGAIVVAAAFGSIALLAPHRLRPLNAAWFRLALLLNRIVSPVVMLVLFAVTIVPFGLVMQRRYDPLRKRRQAGASSYWIERGKSGHASSMLNQF